MMRSPSIEQVAGLDERAGHHVEHAGAAQVDGRGGRPGHGSGPYC